MGDGIITVDINQSLWDPYESARCRPCPPGELVMQQLVWTVQSALESDDPVALTVNGKPARGIFLAPLNGPVAADPTVVASRAANIYSAAISEFVREPPEIMDGPVDVVVLAQAKDQGGWNMRAEKSAVDIPESVQEEVSTQVTSVKSLTWAANIDEAVEVSYPEGGGAKCSIVNDADLVITLDRLDDNEVSVSALYAASNSCEGWLNTFVVERAHDGWAVTGETAPTGVT